MRLPNWAAALAAGLLAAASAAGQEVSVETLAAPDLFTTAGRDTGLPRDLWKEASAATAANVFAALTDKPPSPAAQALARRLLATGAAGPPGAGRDEALAGARTSALIALGDLEAARAVLARTPQLPQRPNLSRAAAEAALLAGEDEAACAIGEALALDRDKIYWLRLRAFCQARRDQAAAAQLTLDIAQQQSRDAVFGRLMAARLGGAAPGAASLRDGLDYALSRAVGADMTGVQAAPAVAGALAGRPPAEPYAELDQAQRDALSAAGLLEAAGAVAAGRPDEALLRQLIQRGGEGEARAKARAQGAALLLAALGWPLSPQARGELAGFDAAAGKAPAGRAEAMALAAEQGLKGETGLLVLAFALDGAALADRIRIVRALRQAGLEQDARAFALEGLLALR